VSLLPRSGFVQHAVQVTASLLGRIVGGLMLDLDKLTIELSKDGRLGNAAVTKAVLDPIDSNGLSADFFRLSLSYSKKEHKLPSRMFVKRSRLTDRGLGEAQVYSKILNTAEGLPTMNCYGIVDDDPAKGLLLLFEDLSDSHRQTDWPIIPCLNDCHGAVTALARIHANWWGRVQSLPAIVPPIVAHQDPVHLSKFFAEFVDYVGEYLSPRRIAEYEKVLSGLGDLIDRQLTTENTTLLHNDPHYWNFLYPNSGKSEDCVVFDWPLWRTGLGGSDLAYLIALHLYPEHRRRFESSMLDRYSTVLSEQGVHYGRDQVQFDYRVGVLIGLLMPIMEFTWKIVTYDWIPKLEKAFAAFDDLDCQELLRV